MNEFNDWWDKHCYGNDKDGVVYRHCKEAWNAAIGKATELVEINFDECEPWLTPEEMKRLEA